MMKYKVQDNMGLDMETNDFSKVVDVVTFDGVIHVSSAPAHACGLEGSSCEHGVGNGYELWFNNAAWKKLKELENMTNMTNKMEIKTLGETWKLAIVNNYVTLGTIIDEDSIPINLTIYVGRGDNWGEVSTTADIHTDIREKYDLDDGQVNALIHSERLRMMDKIAKEFGIDSFGGYGMEITPISKKFLEFLLEFIREELK